MSNGESVFRQIGASNHSLTEREKDDYYATEPKAIDMLLTKERPAAKIWECACGEGHLSKRLIEKGYTVYSSDKVDRGYGEVRDFLPQRAMPADGCDILTNPPYSVALEFIKKALELVGEENRVYMLLRLNFLEGIRRRAELYEPNPPQKVCVFSKRISCARGGDFKKYPQSAIAYAWFVWQKGYAGRTYIEWL